MTDRTTECTIFLYVFFSLIYVFIYVCIVNELADDGNHDKKKAADDWSIITLRYFNPVGNHPSGKIGTVTMTMTIN